MSKTWLVTADRSEARVLAREDAGLVLVQALSNEAGRQRDAEVGTDRPGRVFNRSGAGRHAMESPASPHEQAARVFASQIAHFLRSGRVEGRYGKLVLFAEPHFLGLLRAALDEQTSKLVVRSEARDLQHLPQSELAAHLSGE